MWAIRSPGRAPRMTKSIAPDTRDKQVFVRRQLLPRWSLRLREKHEFPPVPHNWHPVRDRRGRQFRLQRPCPSASPTSAVTAAADRTHGDRPPRAARATRHRVTPTRHFRSPAPASFAPSTLPNSATRTATSAVSVAHLARWLVSRIGARSPSAAGAAVQEIETPPARTAHRTQRTLGAEGVAARAGGAVEESDGPSGGRPDQERPLRRAAVAGACRQRRARRGKLCSPPQSRV